MTRLTGLLLLLASAGLPAVRSVEITDRTPAKKGYEKIVGRVHFGANPKLAANRIVRDLELAPVNPSGEVEYTADFVLIRPQDPARSNGTVLFEVSNRGGKGMLSRFAFARGADDFGDESVLDQGYTLAWLGWEWDVPAAAGLHFTAPHLRREALPAAGLVRSEFVTDRAATSMPLPNRPAEAAIAVEKALALYVREAPEAAARKIPADRWSLGADGKTVEMPGGFELGLLYEFVYEGKDPVVAGTGLAAIRDWISYLKYGGAETALGDQRAVAKRALGFGISQSGRFLRTFLYDGFNADESGRRVFDGVWADVAGAGRGSFNFRYAQPSRDGHPYLNIFYPTDVFPFVDTALLERARAAKAAPKLFLTNNSYEYWGRAAALVHVTPDGKGDAPLSPDTRIYFTAGVAHGPGSLPLNKTGTRYYRDPVDHRPVQRALLAAMQAWLKDGAAPPASVYPKLAERQLTGLAGLKFPAIPDVDVPKHPRLARRLDFGPEFESKGIVTQEPPKVNGAYPLLVPQVDADGIDLGGIRMPEVAVSLGTITGWNLRAPGRGAPEEISEFNGSFFPFAKTKEERGKDVRPSIAERYMSRAEYLQKAGTAADKLIEGRYLLPQDRAWTIDRAARLWDVVMGAAQ